VSLIGIATSSKHVGNFDFSNCTLKDSNCTLNPIVKITTESTELTNNTSLALFSESTDSLFCVDASLALGLLIFWLIIQIVLTAGCIIAVRRYRRMAVEAEEDRAEILARHLYGIHGGNFEIARRVRWADRNDSSIG